MKKKLELTHRQMKEVIGGGPGGNDLDSTKHCYIDGEVIFEVICTTDVQCQRIYGTEASCR